MNDKKTEFIIFGSVLELKKVETESIRVGNEYITATAFVPNIGPFFDTHMKMDLEVKKKRVNVRGFICSTSVKLAIIQLKSIQNWSFMPVSLPNLTTTTVY